MSPIPRKTEAAVAVLVALLFVALALVVGGRTLWLASASPIYDSAAAVPSTAAAASPGPFAGVAGESGRLARELVARDNLRGLSAAVAVNGEVVWAEGFGWTDVETRTPITPLTRFRLGALSKPLTAVGAALLYDQGRLDLDAPVRRYVPAYPDKQWTVTTRQLLGDVGGVHRIRGDNNDAMPVAHCASVNDAVALLAGDTLMFEPGTAHRYSTWGWVLVSAALEGAAQEPFDRFMRRQVFTPLGMERTAVEETDDLGDVAHRGGRPDYSCVAGGGAFLSTPSDLVRLGSSMLSPGFLKGETISAFQTPTRLANGEETTYALGWTVRSAVLGGKPVRIISHRGSPAGGSVSLLVLPDAGVAVAAAANAADARGVDPFALQIAEAFTAAAPASRPR